MAALGNLDGVGNGLREIAESLGHLGGRLEIELVVVEPHPLLIRGDGASLQAQEDVVRLGVVASRVVRIRRSSIRRFTIRSQGCPTARFSASAWKKRFVPASAR